jgi:transcriptional regulator GlxA family with amidase domain
MNTKLNYVQDWQELTRQAQWSVTRLAKLSGVTERTLHRYFIKHMGQMPKDWLAEQRQKLALELLRNGLSVKEMSAQLGYEHSQTFNQSLSPTHSATV